MLEGNFSYKEVILQVFQYKMLPNQTFFTLRDKKQQYGITPEMWTEMHVCLFLVQYEIQMEIPDSLNESFPTSDFKKKLSNDVDTATSVKN